MIAPSIQNWSVDLAAVLAERFAGSRRAARILVMKWSAMGDLALATTVMEDIHCTFPDAEIDLDTPPRFESFFAHDPRFRNVLAVDTRRASGVGLLQWLRVVAAARYDVIIDLQSTDRSRVLISALLLLHQAAPIRVGNHRHWPYNVAPPPQAPQVHALEHLRATIRACGIAPNSTHPVLHAGPGHLHRVEKLLTEHAIGARSYALFMPGCQAAGRLKRWGWRSFSALAIAMAANGIERVFIVGTQEEREECDAIAAACPTIAINLCGQTSILDLIPLAHGASCVVSNDTGTAHVAAVAARPMVVICGPTDPRRVKPAGPQVVTLQADLWCKNCYRKECSHHSCMSVLSPDQALHELYKLGVFSKHA
ncbi:MAG: lipopolysaccharide heptosyltransferase II [Gammaproteobacteria bacterium]|jgi:lipopolysaccharide heptosyltransferase II